MKDKITIIGAGSWGSALARIISDNGYKVIMYDTDEAIVEEINTFHTNIKKLPVGKLNDDVIATTNLKEAVDFGTIILLVVPTAVTRLVLKQINEVISNSKIFVNASKGIEPNTFKRISEIVVEEIDSKYIKSFVVLTGPSHAEEVILGMLTMVTSSSKDLSSSRLIQKILSNKTYFRVYTHEDVIGAELCGSLKNIIAIASGIAHGLGYGDNTRAALITRGLVEIKRIALVLGAEESTIYGLAGLGDLVVTCTSMHSRNFQAGVKIAQGKNLKQTLSEMTMVVEGARTVIGAYQIIKKYNIYAPIIETIYNIVYNQKDPKKEILKLMSSSLKEE